MTANKMFLPWLKNRQGKTIMLTRRDFGKWLSAGFLGSCFLQNTNLSSAQPIYGEAGEWIYGLRLKQWICGLRFEHGHSLVLKSNEEIVLRNEDDYSLKTFGIFHRRTNLRLGTIYQTANCYIMLIPSENKNEHGEVFYFFHSDFDKEYKVSIEELNIQFTVSMIKS